MLEKDVRIIPSLPSHLVIHFRFQLSFSNGEGIRMWLARFMGSLGKRLVTLQCATVPLIRQYRNTHISHSPKPPIHHSPKLPTTQSPNLPIPNCRRKKSLHNSIISLLKTKLPTASHSDYSQFVAQQKYYLNRKGFQSLNIAAEIDFA